MLNNVTINDSAIENGVWTPLLDSSLLIASIQSKRFKQMVFELGDSSISHAEYVKLLASTILLDWANVKDPNGVDIPYSEEMAIIALTTVEPLFTFVDRFSRHLKNFERQS